MEELLRDPGKVDLSPKSCSGRSNLPRRREGGRTTRILLVEDNLVNQKVASKLLNRMGFDVELAADGKAAVEAVTSRKYDLVLMDVQMPEMDGYQATARIRELEKAGRGDRRVPIIAMTAHAMKGDRQKCLASGMDDYLSKPIDPQIMLAKIEKWLAAQENSKT